MRTDNLDIFFILCQLLDFVQVIYTPLIVFGKKSLQFIQCSQPVFRVELQVRVIGITTEKQPAIILLNGNPAMTLAMTQQGNH